MRVSNAIAILLLFLTGYAFGHVAEYHPWLSGLAMVVLGGALAAITMALGGSKVLRRLPIMRGTER